MQSRQDRIIIPILIAFVIVAVVIVAVVSSGGGSGSSSKERTCQVCHRTFTDQSNKSSIARTNMCKNCYQNFEWGMKATGKWD